MPPTLSLHGLGNCTFYSFFPLSDNAKTGYLQSSALVDEPKLYWSQSFESYLQVRHNLHKVVRRRLEYRELP